MNGQQSQGASTRWLAHPPFAESAKTPLQTLRLRAGSRRLLILRMWVAGCIVALGTVCSPALAAAAAATSAANYCDAQWTQVETLGQFQDRLARWQALAPRCGKTGIYEARLAALLTLMHRYDEARTAVRAGLALDTPYKKQLLATRADIDLSAMRFADAGREYQKLIASYPDYYDGYCGMGALMLMEHRISESVRYLTEAARHGHVWIIYRHLTIAYAQLHQWQQAVEAFSTAYQLNPTVIGDRDSAYAAALSLMYLGNFRAADGTIKLLLKANPGASADPQVQRSERIIQGKLQAGLRH